VEIKAIKNERDYLAALSRIESLWDAEPGSEEADTLDVLATLVEAYEVKHHEIQPPDPVDGCCGPENRDRSTAGSSIFSWGERGCS
jgi:antitoxin component HigA of HigAB toxin-antitoxin module